MEKGTNTRIQKQKVPFKMIFCMQNTCSSAIIVACIDVCCFLGILSGLTITNDDDERVEETEREKSGAPKI